MVNNAGVTIDKTVAAMSDDDWHGVIAVNLSGAFFLSQAALAHMLERGTGRIVNVSSVVGETGNTGQANYAASKSPLFGLTKTLAKEAAYHLAKLTRQIPVGRAGSPEEVARVVHFLAADASPTSPAGPRASTVAWTCERGTPGRGIDPAAGHRHRG